MMLGFERHLHREGHTAQALRAAVLDTMRRPEFRHPFYWSGFIVIGQGF
jgi:CHAT domain-containing protein